METKYIGAIFLFILILGVSYSFIDEKYTNYAEEGNCYLNRISLNYYGYSVQINSQSNECINYQVNEKNNEKYYYEKALNSFKLMEKYAIFPEERELASSLSRYTQYKIDSIFASNYEEMIKYSSEVQEEITRINYLIEKMPKYKYALDYFTNEHQNNDYKYLIKSIFVIYLSFSIPIIILLFIDFVFSMISEEHFYEDYILASAILSMTIIVVYNLLTIPEVSYWFISYRAFLYIFVLSIIFMIIFYYIFYNYKRNKIPLPTKGNRVTLKNDYLEMSLEYLKNFEKLKEKELLALLFMKQKKQFYKEELIDKFGKEIITGLIEREYLIEQKSKQIEPRKRKTTNGIYIVGILLMGLLIIYFSYFVSSSGRETGCNLNSPYEISACFKINSLSDDGEKYYFLIYNCGNENLYFNEKSILLDGQAISSNKFEEILIPNTSKVLEVYPNYKMSTGTTRTFSIMASLDNQCGYMHHSVTYTDS